MRLLHRSLLLIAPSLTACGEEIHRLEIFYQDAVVEAPTRQVIVRAISDVSSCSVPLSRVFSEPALDEAIVAEFSNDYPVNPREASLAALPKGERLALEVAGFDGAMNLISRGCTTTEITDDGPDVVSIELRALPKCDDVPTSSLDVLIALDTSLQAALSDSDKAHFTAIREHILKQPNLPISTLFSIVSFGENSMVREVLAPTTNSTMAIASLDGLLNVHTGPSVLFDGMVFATTQLRARAVCGRYPVIIMVAADTDKASAFEYSDAAFGVFGAQGDLSDDIYLAGLPLAQPAYDILNSIVPEDSQKGFLAASGGPVQIDFGFSQIRSRLIQFLEMPPEE